MAQTTMNSDSTLPECRICELLDSTCITCLPPKLSVRDSPSTPSFKPIDASRSFWRNLVSSLDFVQTIHTRHAEAVGSGKQFDLQIQCRTVQHIVRTHAFAWAILPPSRLPQPHTRAGQGRTP
mmetsp:Transcript_79039/g.115796  ORF Transcript_79039/g.115796 Transcript_79039/m.115796 type:complete len:123 (-) Transcript_79039:67-435(-)